MGYDTGLVTETVKPAASVTVSVTIRIAGSASCVTTADGSAEAAIAPERAPITRVLVLAGERYVITHGDLVDAVDQRAMALHLAAEAARSG